ncbi:MAG: preprotein translocase subunit SecE [Proteobacteria bacterium]|nr:preprotein translocase subunit SecE [Pseudomonadota bacterium]
MSDRRVLGFSWLVLSVCLWLVLRDVVSWAFITFGFANPLIGGSLQLSAVVGALVTIITAVVLWRLPQVFDFCLETVQETRKVVWPTRKETRDHTVIVVITSTIIATMLWGFDLVFKRLFKVILDLG